MALHRVIEANQHGDPTVGCVSADAITPNDSTIIDVTRGIYVGGAGNVRVLMEDDSTPVTFMAVPVGAVLPIRVKRVYSTSTTATNLIALY